MVRGKRMGKMEGEIAGILRVVLQKRRRKNKEQREGIGKKGLGSARM